jgi:hypothetical protein
MATALLTLPAFAGLDPVDGMPSFWPQGSSEGLWDTSGDTDIGVCLQAVDTNYVFAFNPANGDLLSQGAFFAFEDTGAIPSSSPITSVQLVVNFDLIGINMSAGVTTFTPQWGPGAGSNLDLVGADTDDFTGNGTFMSAIYTINPATGVAWVFDDLYGTPKPFIEPKGLQGWYFVQVNTGSGSDPNTAQYRLNYLALSVVYGGGPTPPTNWTVNAVFTSSGKPNREFGVVRLT